MISNKLGVPIFCAELADHQHFDLESVRILSVSESKPKKNSKSCVLTDSGKEKLNQALNRKYPKSSYNIVDLAHQTGISRDTISKILQKNQKTVVYKSLGSLFSFLSIDLEESDYENPPKTEGSPRRHNSPLTSPQTDDSILSASDSEKLKNALWSLNYSTQKNSFGDIIDKVKPAAAFLIHGKPDYGQRWLVNILQCKVPYYTDAWHKSIYIKPHRRDIHTLWQSLAQELKTSSSAEAVATELYQHWQTKTVILAIHDVDLIAGSCLKQFMNELWQPLVERVKNSPSPPSFYRLVLFLVDNKNAKSKLEISLPLLEKPDKNQPHIPLALQELEPFNLDVIETWVGVQSQCLSQLWKSSESIEQVMREIVERDNQPLSVLRDICQCFDLDWEEHIAGKLAL